MTIPLPVFEFQEHHTLSTVVAYRCGRLPTSNRFYALASFYCLPPYLLHELTEAEVRDFLPPETFHTFEIQILKETYVKQTDEVQCKFPVMVFALASDLAVCSGVVFACAFTIVTTALFSRQRSIRFCNLVSRLFIELRRLILLTIRTGEKGFETEIKPSSLTHLRFGTQTFVICHDGQIPIAQCVTFHGNTFHVAFEGTVQPKAIPSCERKVNNFFISYIRLLRRILATGTRHLSLRLSEMVSILTCVPANVMERYLRHPLNLGGRFARRSKKLI